MDKDNATPKGDNPYKKPTVHSQSRRAGWHDYSAPGTYMVTIAIDGRRDILGQLQTGSRPAIALSEFGAKVLNAELGKIPQVYSMVEIWESCIMPDHIHLIIHINRPLPSNKHLGNVIGAFKGGCSRLWRQSGGKTGHEAIFEEGYNDRILMDDGQLDNWRRYIRDNPRRLALKRAHPDLFKVWHNISIGKWQCQMIGNIFFLDQPDIMAVIVHRADSDEVYNNKFKEWMACGERGGILVSASIAKREKQVMREAMTRGYRLIVLRENGFNKYYKPSGASFDACAKGLMLQICPWEYHYDTHVISRSQCLELNELATCISKGK